MCFDKWLYQFHLDQQVFMLLGREWHADNVWRYEVDLLDFSQDECDIAYIYLKRSCEHPRTRNLIHHLDHKVNLGEGFKIIPNSGKIILALYWTMCFTKLEKRFDLDCQHFSMKTLGNINLTCWTFLTKNPKPYPFT